MASADRLNTASPRDVRVFDRADALMQVAADEIVRGAATAIAATGRFVIALSGGSTPASLYELLASPTYAPRIDWKRVHVFWGDERCVPPGDPASNYRMACGTLLDHVPIPPVQIHRMHGEDEAHRAADSYEHELRLLFGTPAGPPSLLPGTRFDLVLLGMGNDGHTASLFPGTAAALEAEEWVVGHYVAAQSMWRLTLTAPIFNAAAEVMFLVTGSDKAAALRRVLADRSDGELLPAQRIKPQAGMLRWFVDRAAAAGGVEPPL